MPSAVETCLPDWEKLHRLIPSHFPPIDLFENVVDPEDLELAFAIESLTNDRLLMEAGDLTLIPEQHRISGPGTTPVMAAFTHIHVPSRFTDGTAYGVYYGARELHTAIEETKFHRAKFLAATNEPDTELTMRCYVNQIAMELHDVRHEKYAHLHADDYEQSQLFAEKMRNAGSNGLLYNSVRHEGGECIAAFHPKAVTVPVQGGHYKYIYSAKQRRVVHVLEVSLVM